MEPGYHEVEVAIPVIIQEHPAARIGREVSAAGVTFASGLSGQEAVVLSAGPFLTPGQTVKPTRTVAR